MIYVHKFEVRKTKLQITNSIFFSSSVLVIYKWNLSMLHDEEKIEDWAEWVC